ncbi:antiviral RADAR system adenosine triphosphatase RdrA [Chromobacterium sp. Panama]|uniref:antiviral RADAR system adenosine triphosphatase RdrA n=1 Tax=Chromobacterium sp. Panama TaxID=2161826 RepID=UPI0011B1E19B|nr:antiviral RADAR system adenosine triphosphatase RdrA [Chromobacterium sp. Panama]
MPARSDLLQEPIYYPLNQGERASHLHVDQLLPRDVYERLAEMLQESLQQQSPAVDGEPPEPIDGLQQFARGRGHTTVFLDGGRGTGKTTVIVNLQAYLRAPSVRDSFEGVADQVHILQPIDPSQLEDDDDLFLNVVVAAVLGDEEIQRGREKDPVRWQALYDSLQHLGTALAGKETQSDGVGLDRLRSFMGAQELASAVHDFFAKAANLLEKRLLVLPIDDVDTTLHRAFENLEVVRRYLASPVLLPIVCGDLRLYHEVTWRDAFRRLTKDVAGFHSEARPTAVSLAVEYLRKIFPLHRRLRMPEVGTFLRNDRILLGTPRDGAPPPRLTLPDLEAWLRALLAGAVNDHENSRLPIPIPTVRALSQLLARVQAGIPALELAFHNETAPHPVTDLMRRIVYRRHGETPQALRRGESHPEPATAESKLSLAQWQSALFNHFMFEPGGGAVCLVLMAARHWREAPSRSVLDTPLFAPLKQVGQHDLRYIEARAALNWKTDLTGRLPESWVNTLAEESILPFATPEIGRAVVPDRWQVDPKDIGDDGFSETPRVLIELITHRNFYSPSKRATLICSGRILELVVTSLVRNVSAQDIDRILTTAPFHSAVAVAATKAAHITVDELESSDLEGDEDTAGEEPSEEGSSHAELDDTMVDRDLAIDLLAQKINEWRREVEAHRLPLSPWLIYCALNKTFNQAPLFTRPLQYNEQPSKEALSNVVASGLSAFNSFWAAVASFEKGPLFDLPLELSNVNLLNRRGDFQRNDLFTQNIRPLLRKEHGSIRGERVISTTWALGEHPLRGLLQDFFDLAKEREEDPTTVEEDAVDGRTHFLKMLGFPKDRKRLSVAAIVKALEQSAPKGSSPARYGKSIFNQLSRRFPRLAELTVLERAIAELELRAAGTR